MNWKKYLAEAPRIVLGIIFLLSGIGKIIDHSNAIYLVELMATEFYRLVEWRYEIVYLTIAIELLLSALLFFKIKPFSTFLFAGLFLCFFTAVTAFFYIEGFDITSCGCFGAFGFSGGLEATLIRNIVLLMLASAGMIVYLKKSPPKPEFL